MPTSYGATPWRQQEGITVFAPFEQDSEMIGPPEKTWMINFRVDDLDAMVDQLRGAGETVDVNPERFPNGRFADLRDPEGNGIELGSRWTPSRPADQRSYEMPARPRALRRVFSDARVRLAGASASATFMAEYSADSCRSMPVV